MREIIFYETSAGNIPVAVYIKRLNVKAQAKVARALDLLEEYGPAVGAPHVKHLAGTGGLYELRVPFGGQAHRILFFLDGADIVLVHGFTKKADKIPKRELETAISRMKDYLQRRRTG